MGSCLGQEHRFCKKLLLEQELLFEQELLSEQEHICKVLSVETWEGPGRASAGGAGSDQLRQPIAFAGVITAGRAGHQDQICQLT